jgi:hypothetical protein
MSTDRTSVAYLRRQSAGAVLLLCDLSEAQMVKAARIAGQDHSLDDHGSHVTDFSQETALFRRSGQHVRGFHGELPNGTL